MIPQYLSALWAAIAPPLGNHLWQSTLFAVVAGLSTLSLRKNHARTRYWLWLAASGKFLIPFSLLVGIGSHLSWSHRSAGTKAGLYITMDEVSQPFAQPAMSVILRGTPSTASLSLTHLLPTLLTAAWLSGFLVVLVVWCRRWRRISAAIRAGVTLREGREVEALRRLERIVGIRKKIEMLRSRATLEPGIFGIARPKLIWPEGISERLEDEHLEAILAHELWHVRHRDNLAAAIHMIVESLFWFHPLVWWLGARLLEERECACDQDVLELGSKRRIYAESILKVCEFCVESPLACVSGVTGADLKKRMVYIMTDRISRKLDLSRKLLLSAAGLVAIVGPIFLGLVNATSIRAESQAENAAASTAGFEVASIKPHNPSGIVQGEWMKYTPYGFTATNITLQMLIRDAYQVQDFQISGAPDWLNSEKYDIQAKMEQSVADELRKLDPLQSLPQRQRLLQALLEDRLKLSLHRETKEQPIYALVIAKDGPKLQEAKPGDTYPNGIKDPKGRGHAGMVQMQPGKLMGQGVPVTELIGMLSREGLGRTILDKTGLMGKYDFTLQWTPDEGPAGRDSSGSSIFTAIQDQLGLELESQDGPVETLVIDHVERPAEN